jgi:hypothetical protein
MKTIFQQRLENINNSFEKAKLHGGTYANTPENRKLGRVGQPYGSDSEGLEKENLKEKYERALKAVKHWNEKGDANKAQEALKAAEKFREQLGGNVEKGCDKETKKSEELLKSLEIDIVKARYVDNPQNKKQGRVGQEYGGSGKDNGKDEKPHVNDYIKNLGAEKWNKSKLKREMDHHSNMAKLTNDSGHVQVYEHLSKIHKDHPDHLDDDKKEIKEKATERGLATKAKNKRVAEKAKKEGEDWDNKHSAIYNGEDSQKAGSKERKDIAETLRTKGKNIINTLKEEVSEWKEAGQALSKVYMGKDITPKEKNLIKTAASHIATIVGSEKAAKFISGMMNHYLEGILGKKAAVLSKAEGEALPTESLKKLFEEFADFIENGDIDEKVTKKFKPKKDKEITEDKKDKKMKKSFEEELELLSSLGVDIEKAKSYKGLVPVKKMVQKKGKAFQQTFWISPEEAKEFHKTGKLPSTAQEEKKPKINKNTKVGGGSEIGASISALVAAHAQKTGKNVSNIKTELAHYSGYHLTKQGTVAADPKNNIDKIIQGKVATVPDDKLEKIADYFGKTKKELLDMAEASGEQLMQKTGKISEIDFSSIKHAAGEFNYGAVKRVIGDGSAEADEKVIELLRLGLRDAGKIMELSGHDNYFEIKEKMEELELKHTDNDGFDMNVLLGSKPKAKNPKSKWSGYKDALNDVVNGDIPFVLVFGKGGIGKTYNAEQVIFDKEEGHGLREFDPDPDSGMVLNGDEYDAVVYGGRSGVKGMVETLFEHRDKLIVFDDFDSVIMNPDGTDILKNAFAPDVKAGKRRVTYKSQKLETGQGQSIPSTFNFNGRVVIITNLEPSDIPQPMLDRSLPIDLTMERFEIMQKLKEIHVDMKLRDSSGKELDIPTEIRGKAYDFIDSNKYYVDVDNLTPRRFSKAAKYLKSVAQQSEDQLKGKYGENYMSEIEGEMFRRLEV